jgi:sodium/potassium-transporting ATPase subunit alpha
MNAEKFIGKNKDELFLALHADEAGLSSSEAGLRQKRYGKNQILFHPARSPLLMFLQEFTALFPLLLLGAALLAFFADMLSVDEGYDLIGAALIGVVLLNALVSFVQNYRVEKLMLSFLDYIPKQVALLRDGQRVFLDAKEVVPGDILFVQEGDKISADGILLSSQTLLVDESVLSGESERVEKSSLEERVQKECLVYSGATVMKGSARLLVSKTGRATDIGSISTLSQNVRTDLTPMQKELQLFARKITLLALGIGALFFLIGLAIGNPFWTNLIFAIGIIVANVPEGLLPTVTLALNQSSLRMSKRNAIIKHILSVETLGSTTVICTDKTGTLTQNSFDVEALYMNFEELSALDTQAFLNNPAASGMLEIMGLCNEAISSRGHFKGDQTDIAMAYFVERVKGYDELRSRFEHLDTQPFDANKKQMSGTFKTMDGTLYMTVKGASEVILEKCSQVHAQGKVRELLPSEKELLSAQAGKYATDGLRVLALAYRIVDAVEAAAEELVFVGLVAMTDPPRPEVPAAVKACKSAGIRIIVISGDKAETVRYITQKLGIAASPLIIEGEQMAQMSKEELAQLLQNKEIAFARIAPEQKLDIVEALKHTGEVVAVTGDGVNDAPALKRADIGISMGLRGTDVAKEASDIILLDDNFATIIKAIEEGRRVYDNIKKFITYILTSNVPELLPFIIYVLFPIPLAITVIQILCIDLITDMLPAIGLGNEEGEADIMRRPPRSKKEHLVSAKTFLRSYAIIGVAQTLLSYIAFFAVLLSGGWSMEGEMASDPTLYLQASAAFLATIIFSQIGNVMACRTNRQSALSLLLRPNPLILIGVIAEVLFIVSIIYLPFLNPVFSTAPFALEIWLLILPAPFVIFAIEEIRKYLVRRGCESLSV